MKFGPVRHCDPRTRSRVVFEVAFEGLARSARHKSGVAMRFPRISRLRWDSRRATATASETLERLLATDEK